MSIARSLFPIFMAALLAACVERTPIAPAAASQIATAQRFEIVIDGVPHKMEPDDPRDGHVVMAAVVQDRQLLISAMDRRADFSFTAHVETENQAPLGPGEHPSFECRMIPDCDKGKREGALVGSAITPFQNGEPFKPIDIKMAYKAPAIGLAPLVVTIASLEDVVWPGAGKAKRVKGTFKGSLAHIESQPNSGSIQPKVVGPLKQVEGRFDLYALAR